MRKSIIAGLAVALTVLLFPGITSFADDKIKIDETNFPDEKFSEYVKENIDIDKDGYINMGERSRTNWIDVSNKGIGDLKGIELFFGLKHLYCHHNSLTKLDISSNPSLENLNCSFNDITELDISSTKCISQAYGENAEYLDKDGMPNEDDPAYVQYSWDEYGEEEDTIYSLILDVKVKVINHPINLSVKTNFPVVGKPHQITVKQGEDNVTKSAKWTLSDETMATIDDKGELTAKKAGYLAVTADVDGVRDTINLFILYKDVSSSKDFWYEPTNVLTRMGVVKGYKEQSEFRPANKCTRAQMVTFIWRLMGEPEPKTDTCKFSDVKESDYFYKACIWGNEKGIVEGYKDGTFGPQITCARKHAVTFLWRLAGKPEPNNMTCKFKDVKEKDYYYIPVIWANENHILEGYNDGTFRADNDCLRRQMVTFLWRYYLNRYYDLDKPLFNVDRYLLTGRM